MRRGGSYKAEKGQKPKRVDGTEPHPEGNRARAADGTPLDEQGRPIAAKDKPEPSRAQAPPEASPPTRATKAGGE